MQGLRGVCVEGVPGAPSTHQKYLKDFLRAPSHSVPRAPESLVPPLSVIKQSWKLNLHMRKIYKVKHKSHST